MDCGKEVLNFNYEIPIDFEIISHGEILVK